MNIVEKLHPLERKILPLVDSNNFLDLVKQSNLKDVEVMRAVQWLENKNLIKIDKKISKVIDLAPNGKNYARSGLPERRFLEALKGKMPVAEVAQKAKLSKDEINVCLGVLRKKAAIAIGRDKHLIVKALPNAENLLTSGFLEEKLLKKNFPLRIDELKDEEKFALENLKKRKDIIRIEEKTTIETELTELGKQALRTGLEQDDIIDRVTKKILEESSWKKKKFRGYDIKINVPEIFGAKKQHYRRFLDEVRAKFMSLGFKEMFGPIVETDFWDMDALFMPQFHSARDIHSAYYVKEPRYGDIDKDLISKVKKSHEKGYNTGSRGWNYAFDTKKTKRHLLRTQGTALSARMLASKNLRIPGKYFAIARCFRPDVVDATHSVDFNQVEGIVIEEGLDFRHLKGLLRLFAREFAETEKIKITPAYFPFTEPSAELHAKHPDLGWVELGGSGIFRPEVVKPLLGKEIPVLAWGIGIDRIAMFKLGIGDIRQLFSHDLKMLRQTRVI